MTKNTTNQDGEEIVEITNFDDFLSATGDSILLAEEEEEDSKTNIFKKPKDVDTSFLDEEEEEEKNDPISKIIEDTEDDDEGSKPDASKPGRKKVDKSGLVETFSKLVEKGVIVPFDDDKELSDYTQKDFEELLEVNLEEKEKNMRENITKEIFESLPEELQAAAQYVANGGKDMKSLFKALAITEETKSLDPKEDADIIIRQYLRSTNFGTDAEIEAQIQEWDEIGRLEMKATAFKPKLDAMHEKVVQENIKRQEDIKLKQKLAAEEYTDNIYETLKVGELNGVKIDKKTQQMLFSELTTAKYESLNGRRTNLLGHLLEKYQFSEPRYDLIVEATWLLNDPEGYRESIKQLGATDNTSKVARMLKTEQKNKLGSGASDDDDTRSGTQKRQGIKRPVKNIFARD